MVKTSGRNFGLIPFGSGKVPFDPTVMAAGDDGPCERLNTEANGWVDTLLICW